LNNYKLTIEYDGTNYAGWQIQNNAVTVQQKISDAVEVIIKEKINLIGSGRTDTGVHALGQVANFRTDQSLDLWKFQYSLNCILPNVIAVKSIDVVGEEFHSRFDAKRRSYIYLFTHIKSPFFEKYSWLSPSVKNIDLVYLNKISKSLLGEHDFTSLSKKNVKIDDKRCSIYEIHWRRTNDKTIFFITANRFLHGMVRTIVGTLIYAVENKLDEKYINDVLVEKDRTKAEESVPARGLFLYKVRY
jgi:tRNA pseudouridine38-40 synthase